MTIIFKLFIMHPFAHDQAGTAMLASSELINGVLKNIKMYLSFLWSDFGWNGIKDEKGRQLLQWLGTDVSRKTYPDTWVDMVAALLKGIKTLYDYVIIPDVRFPNEIDKMYDDFDCVASVLLKIDH